MRRRVAIWATSAAVAVLALLAVLHAPPIRARVFTWVIAQLESRYQLTLTSDTFRYNIVTGTVTLENVRLAAHGAAQPFFTATRVRADVPLSAYAGRLILDDVEVDGGRVEMLTDANGVSNLPASDPNKPPPADPRSLNIHGLHLRDFAFVYDDRTLPIRVTATGIDTTLDHRQIRVFDGVTGPFAVKGGIDVQFSERALRIEPIDSRLAFDGSNVSMQELPIVTAMGPLSLSGRVNRVLDTMSLELEFEGPIDVAQAASWAPPPMPVSGTVRVQGTLNGPLKTLDTVVRVDTDALAAGDERGLNVERRVRDRSPAHHLQPDRRLAGQRRAGECGDRHPVRQCAVHRERQLSGRGRPRVPAGERVGSAGHRHPSGRQRPVHERAAARSGGEGRCHRHQRAGRDAAGRADQRQHRRRSPDGGARAPWRRHHGERHRHHPHRQRPVPPVHARAAHRA